MSHFTCSDVVEGCVNTPVVTIRRISLRNGSANQDACRNSSIIILLRTCQIRDIHIVFAGVSTTSSILYNSIPDITFAWFLVEMLYVPVEDGS